MELIFLIDKQAFKCCLYTVHSLQVMTCTENANKYMPDGRCKSMGCSRITILRIIRYLKFCKKCGNLEILRFSQEFMTDWHLLHIFSSIMTVAHFLLKRSCIYLIIISATCFATTRVSVRRCLTGPRSLVLLD